MPWDGLTGIARDQRPRFKIFQHERHPDPGNPCFGGRLAPLAHAPVPAQAGATEALYATWLHEGAHATGHKSRLDRNFAGKFGADERSREELVAEPGSAFLRAGLAVTPVLRDDHAHYVAHGLEILRGDKKAVFTAAAAANRAAEFLHALQPAEPEFAV